MKRSLSLAFLMAAATPVPAAADWSCADAIHASATCPWLGPTVEGHAVPPVAVRWSSEGYLPGSAVGRWTDGIHVILRLPRSEPHGAANLWIDVGYEPHWQPDEARALVPVEVTLRLGDVTWRAREAHLQESSGPAADIFEGPLHRFTFDADIVAAMLAGAEAAPLSDAALHADDPPGVLHVDILFQEQDGGFVSANDILQIDSGECRTRCAPRVSLAGFAEAFRQGVAMGGEAE